MACSSLITASMVQTPSQAQLAVILIGLTLSVACGFTGMAAQPTSPFASDALRAATLAPVLSATPSDTTPIPSKVRTPTLTLDPCGMSKSDAAIEYRVSAQIDPERRSLRATLRAAYRNTADAPLETLFMYVDSNNAEGVFTLEALASAPESAVSVSNYVLEKARLALQLEQPLPVGCRAVVQLTFTLRVPSLPNARRSYLSYTERQLNLGHWLPEFAPRLDDAWMLPQASLVGEYMLSELADFEAEIVLSGTTPADLIAPGNVERLGDRNWRVRFRNGRSLPLVISSAMARLSTQTANGETIDLYYFVTANSAPSAAHLHALKTARQAVERFSQLFGTLFYDRLVVVEADFHDGMEFSGLVHVGSHWFATFNGRDDSWLTLITAHEVAHQWWYAQVMTAQGDAPYLDEALSIYAELLYLESVRPDLVPWWWTFRVKTYQPNGYVDAAVYEFRDVRAYINAVYLRGAQMLQAIREALGDAAFFTWLRRYLYASSGKIATPQDFWRAMSAEEYLYTAEIRLRFLRMPDVLPVATPTPADLLSN
ncbi:MAG: M1 family aminopeptidase [Anaerolineae bacterium]|nr:M1 family aminopeptidase [Anaerolineae bacterium]